MSDKAQTTIFSIPLPLVLWCIHRTATARGTSAPDCRTRANRPVLGGRRTADVRAICCLCVV